MSEDVNILFKEFLTNVSLPKKVEWIAPNKMILDLGNGPKLFELLKGAEEFLHKQIDIKVATSKELYKKAESVWKDLRDIQLQKCKDNPNERERFELNAPSVVYLTTIDSYDRDTGVIVDIIDLKNGSVDEFKDINDEFNIIMSTRQEAGKFFQNSKGGLYKFVCYASNVDVESARYVPIILLELNHEKSIYRVYSGIMDYKHFIFIPAVSCDIEDKKYYDFLNHFNMRECLDYSKERADELYESYLAFNENPVDISARELTALLKKVGYKLELDSADKLHPIENLSDGDNNQKVQDFYNTFQFTTGETAMDILQLSDFRKTFRYNKMTLLDVLAILSKEYMEYDGSKITAEILGDIVFKLYTTGSADKSQVAQVEKEIN